MRRWTGISSALLPLKPAVMRTRRTPAFRSVPPHWSNDGRIVTGCNVENASYGLTLCAECGLISTLHASGGGQLVAVACVDGTGAVLMPCGRCRQLLWEHGGAECLIDTPAGTWSLSAVLPQAFGADDLARGKNEH